MNKQETILEVVNALNTWYSDKYNNFEVPRLDVYLKPFGVEYTNNAPKDNNKRYLKFEDGEIIRLDKFCKQNGVQCDYLSNTTHETTKDGEHIQRAKYSGKRKEKRAEKRFESSISFFGNIGDSLREAQKANEYKKPLLDENEALKAKIKELEEKIATYEKKAAKKRKAN